MKKSSVAVAVAVGALALAGCSAGGSQDPSGPSSAQSPSAPGTTTSPETPEGPTAAQSPTSSGSASADAGGEVDGAELGEAVGRQVRTEGTGRFRLTSNGTRIGEGSFDLDAKKASTTVHVQGRRIRTVQVGDTLYIRGLTHGKQPPWVAVKPGGSNPLSKLLVALGGTRSNDPSDVAALLGKATIVDQGTRQLDGQQVHAYRATVPVSAYGAVTSPQLADTLERLIDGPVQMRYLISDENLPVRVTSALKVGGQRQATTVDYSGWGEPVHISAPPKSQVTDASALSQQPV